MNTLEKHIISDIHKFYQSVEINNDNLKVLEVLNDTVFCYCLILYFRNQFEYENLFKMHLDKEQVLKHLADFAKCSESTLSMIKIQLYDTLINLKEIIRFRQSNLNN